MLNSSRRPGLGSSRGKSHDRVVYWRGTAPRLVQLLLSQQAEVGFLNTREHQGSTDPPCSDQEGGQDPEARVGDATVGHPPGLAALVGVGWRMSRESSERSAVQRVWRDLAASSSLEEALTGRYEPLGVVGQGSFAKVFLARHILTGTKVAVKVLQKGVGATLSWVLSELDIMKDLEHPHVVQLLEIVETPSTAYVVMEHMAGGQLGQHIPEVVGLWEDEARMLFRQVASAVGYCHAQGIAHRDVKADNVLLDAAGRAKLCDFGLACRFRAGEKLGLLCGTVAYWAPELHRQEPYDGPAVDVWSLGVLLFLMLTGCIPFTGASYAQAKEQVLQARYHLPFHLSLEAQSLVSWMLTLEPAHRPTLQQILGHPWLSQDGDRCPSPPAELLPKRPDTSILLAMLDLGYGLQETWVSVATRQFNEAMATYLLLGHQKTQGAGCQVRLQIPGWPQVGPCPSQSIFSSLTLGPRWGVSRPAIRSWPLSACEQQQQQQQQPEELKPSGQVGSRRASLPAIMLCSLSASIPAPGPTAPLPGSSQALAQDPSSYSTKQPPTGTRTPGLTRDTTRGWRGVVRRMATCLARLCCCLKTPRTSSGRSNRVAPAAGGPAPPPAPRDPPEPAPTRDRWSEKCNLPWPPPLGTLRQEDT
ncbi:sperm motility kinase 2B-like [Callospermophilus lateralis]|uniref:sperm motility kinase 2B-like n=1 Tax=Callospermophilus lateralis TaxID=76772 RepID=UPI004053E51C